jgi:anti-anti-sigma factor
MHITTLQSRSDVHTVQPHCRALVSRNAAAFAEGLLPMNRQGLRLEIDLSEVRQMDGAGMGALLTCGQAIQREGGQLVLTHVAAPLKAELRACGLDSLLAWSVTDQPHNAH